MRVISRLIAPFSAICLGASAFATQPLTQADNGLLTVAPSSAPVAAAKSAEALGAHVIFSNFGTDGPLYDCCSGWGVSGARSMGGRAEKVAMPFTPVAPAVLKRVRLAMGLIGGTDLVKFSLHLDTDGLPGPVLKELRFTQLPEAGTCCQVLSTGFGGVALEGGQTYWLVARVPTPHRSDTLAIWNTNIARTFGPMAKGHGKGWERTEDAQGAFEVLSR